MFNKRGSSTLVATACSLICVAFGIYYGLSSQHKSETKVVAQPRASDSFSSSATIGVSYSEKSDKAAPARAHLGGGFTAVAGGPGPGMHIVEAGSSSLSVFPAQPLNRKSTSSAAQGHFQPSVVTYSRKNGTTTVGVAALTRPN